MVSSDLHIGVEPIKKASIVDGSFAPVQYLPSQFGLDDKYTGNGVKIAVLDTGEPVHKDIRSSKMSVSFCSSSNYSKDIIGHSTLVSGVIFSNNSHAITGIANRSEPIYGKVICDNKKGSFNALVSGLLWCIVKEVDIIVLALGCQYDYRIFHDSIIKARERGICIFAASGPNANEYPAAYKEVFSCGFLGKEKNKNSFIKSNVDFYLPNQSLYSTYLDNQYVKTGGSSISTAIFAGLGSVLIEQNKGKVKKEEMPSFVYNNLIKIVKQY